MIQYYIYTQYNENHDPYATIKEKRLATKIVRITSQELALLVKHATINIDTGG